MEQDLSGAFIGQYRFISTSPWVSAYAQSSVTGNGGVGGDGGDVASSIGNNATASMINSRVTNVVTIILDSSENGLASKTGMFAGIGKHDSANKKGQKSSSVY